MAWRHRILKSSVYGLSTDFVISFSCQKEEEEEEEEEEEKEEEEKEVDAKNLPNFVPGKGQRLGL